MDRERWKQIDRLFQATLELPAEERETFLRAECAGDPELEHEVRSLLESDEAVGSFLEHPAAEAAAEAMARNLAGGAPVTENNLAGRSILHYRIVSKLGAGGMGEVWRARDTKLNRDVALKILPEVLSHDPELMARFKREARVLASLNHPNIAAIYGSEESDGVSALAMELVEGQTLAHRLKSAPIALDEALPIAKQIAEALEYAHEKGVVHRDLKPANIGITSDGTVKVLDFGLAKALDVDAPGTDPANSPTASPSLSLAATRTGVILGTASYMSPEQARGKRADRRTDIWAFGCVLFEMITGKRLFEGETVSDTLAAILKTEPELGALPGDMPPRLRELIRRCLTIDPRQRLRDIGEARIAIEGAIAGVATGVFGSEDEPTAHADRRSGPSLQRVLLFAVGLLLGATLAGLFVWRTFVSRTPATRAISTSILAPAGSSFRFTGSGFALSPDGRQLAYVAANGKGKTALWVRSLDTQFAQELPGTEGAISPFWSPDSKFIAFISGGKLQKVQASGGLPTPICDTNADAGGTWNRDGDILFARHAGAPIYRVSATGGTPVAVTRLNKARKERANLWPYFLPDGRHFLYLAGDPYAPPKSGINRIFVGSLDSKETTFLLKANSGAVYASGYLLFLRGNTLMAQRFDPQRLKLEGDAIPLAEKTMFDAFRLKAQFSVSNNGLMAYASSTRGTGLKLQWFDSSGKQLGAVPDKDAYCCPRLSPDGSKVVYDALSGGTRYLWVYDFVRGTKTRLTFGTQNVGNSVWSPDGRHILFSSNRNDLFGLYEMAADGSGTEKTVLPPSEGGKFLWGWSPDGKFLSYLFATPKAGRLMILPLAGGRKPFRFTKSDASLEAQASFSPDGKWLAYVSNETGPPEIYAAAFPGPGSRYQVSTNVGYGFGQSIRWAPDGKNIFYITLDKNLMAVPIKEKGSSLEIGKPHLLFEVDNYGLPPVFDVTPDSRRFIITTFDDQATRPITLLVHWPAMLEKK
jgi:serine/threonine protein kinase